MRLSEMRTEVTPKKINKVMERSFGFTIDYDNLTYAKAQRLSHALAENIHGIKRSFGAHTAERNPKYMELMMVKEGLDRWMHSEQGLFESEMGRSEAVLAAKDIVDSMQDMLEKISKVQNEQMPALVDTIRDQIGAEQADAFKAALTPLLMNLYESLMNGREQADTAVRQLAGEQVAGADMSMAGGMAGDMSGAPAGPNGMGAAPAPGGESDMDQESDEDLFGASDAAVGGSGTELPEPELGRKRR